MTPVFKWGAASRDLSEELKRPMREQNCFSVPPPQESEGVRGVGLVPRAARRNQQIWGFCRDSSRKTCSLLSPATGI